MKWLHIISLNNNKNVSVNEKKKLQTFSKSTFIRIARNAVPKLTCKKYVNTDDVKLNCF